LLIDLDHLARATAGEAALQRELLGLFHAQVCATQELLADDPQRVADQELAAVLHRLRGAARAIGAEPLATQLGRMEEMLGREATDDLRVSAFAELRAGLRLTAEAVDRLLGPRADGLAKAGETG
jgi:HPt (histidine-containing phosphotransfer) domain-containing protein